MSEDFYWQLLQENPKALIWEEYEQAFLGIGSRDGMKSVAVYDVTVLQGLIIEEILSDKPFMKQLSELHNNNEEAITQDVVKESVRTYIDKIFTDTEGELEETAPPVHEITDERSDTEGSPKQLEQEGSSNKSEQNKD